MAPTTMRALKVGEDKKVRVEQAPVPKLGATDVLLKVVAIGYVLLLYICHIIALSHLASAKTQLVHKDTTCTNLIIYLDWKHATWISEPGAAIGCDFVGEVVEIGPNVPSGAVELGQIRGGFMRGGMSPDRGAFAEYATQEYDLTFLVPKNVTPAQAASIPIPYFTAAQAFYLRLGLPFPDEDNSKVAGSWILIWSGSTAVGQYAIQLAKLAGLKVATTCSPRRNDLVKSLGADVVVDYNDPKVSEKLFEATDGQIKIGLDTHSEGGSLQASQKAFSKEGGHLIVIQFNLKDLPRPEVKTEPTLIYTALGFDAGFGNLGSFPTSDKDRSQYVRSLKLITSLLEDGRIKPSEVTNLGGLDDVQKGFEMMAEGKHNTKIVYTV